MKENLNFKLEIKSEKSENPEMFDGPLDLMLSLIAKHKLNIQDIEISVLLEQFLNYIERTQAHNIELAGEFLEAAARLIYIKTVSLLPKHEAETLKKELEGALIEYALCKSMAAKLRKGYVGDVIFTRFPLKIEVDLTYNLSHSVSELIEAISLAEKKQSIPELPDKVIEEKKINYVKVFTKILFVLKRIRNGGQLEIKQLFSEQDRSSQIATFLALLELSSHGRIAFSEDLEYIEFVKREVKT